MQALIEHASSGNAERGQICEAIVKILSTPLFQQWCAEYAEVQKAEEDIPVVVIRSDKWSADSVRYLSRLKFPEDIKTARKLFSWSVKELEDEFLIEVSEDQFRLLRAYALRFDAVRDKVLTVVCVDQTAFPFRYTSFHCKNE
jgi:hypothetical protein